MITYLVVRIIMALSQKDFEQWKEQAKNWHAE